MRSLRSDKIQRVLVTGSRGKSSIVRFLHVALQDAGLETYARITGVDPRQLGPVTCSISRSSGAHVEEMRWWLGSLPETAQAVVLENSAITPDLQDLAGRWLQPGLTILSNVLPDHQEVWGPSSACAAEVLTSGIPEQTPVILPADLESNCQLLDLLKQRRCQITLARPVSGVDMDFHASNLGLALTAVEQLGLAKDPALGAMLALEPDKYDFRVVDRDGTELAMAFSVNDISSTRRVFRSLSWSEEETCLIYNHRNDRPGRFKSFLDWLNDSRWRQVLVIGDRPSMRHCSGRYLRTRDVGELIRLFKPGSRVFGCGNIAGLPLELARDLDP
ncbi:MAG: hypothetical protein GY732_20040 [Gammaproteobacteria bacterium]|nr:hypothetical protein [Gammaproteobacteria bacterium]